MTSLCSRSTQAIHTRSDPQAVAFKLGCVSQCLELVKRKKEADFHVWHEKYEISFLTGGHAISTSAVPQTSGGRKSGVFRSNSIGKIPELLSVLLSWEPLLFPGQCPFTLHFSDEASGPAISSLMSSHEGVVWSENVLQNLYVEA